MAFAAPEHPLGDGVIEVRLASDGDLDVVERASRDPEIASRFGLTTIDASAYLRGYQAAWRDGTGAAFAISDAGGECVGQILVERREAGRVDVGYWLLAEARGRGRATRGLALVSRWALRQPGVARLQLWTTPENMSSQRVAERAGFRREGVLRSYAEAGGRRVDAVFFSLLAADLDGLRQ